MNRHFAAKSFTSLFLLQLWKLCDSTCTLPTAFTGSWWDSRTNAAFTISSLQVTDGWQMTVTPGQGTGTFNQFTCVVSNDTHWVFRSDNRARLFSVDYHAVLCMQYAKINDNSYYYYLIAGKISALDNSRVSLKTESEAATYTTISQFCPIPGDGDIPDAREYDVLVKENLQSSIHIEQYLPDPLLGVFDYTVTDSSSTTCNGVSSVWDGCYVGGNLDRTTITLNYTLCGTTVMGAASGIFYKVAHVFHSDTYYVTLINSAGVSTLFTCIAVTQSGNTRSVSTNPGGCAEGQVASSRTSDSNSQLITLTEYETCLFTTTTNPGSSTDSSSGTTVAVVGVVLSLLLLIAIIIIGYLLYKKYLQPRKSQITHRTSLKHPADGKQPLPPDSDFTLSDICMKREPTMADDLVIDSLSPRDRAIPMERVMSRQSAHSPLPDKQHVENDMVVEPLTPTGNIENPFDEVAKPMPELQRAPTGFKWMKRIPEKDAAHGLSPLDVKPNLTTNSAWEAPKPLPAIHKQ